MSKSAGVSLSDPGLSLLFGPAPTAAGTNVSPETAMRCPAVFACIKVIAESVSQLPLILYRRTADGGKERATDHPLYTLLHDQPNDWTSSTEFRQTMQAALSLHGNAYAYIGRSGDRVVELIPLPSASVAVTVDSATVEPRYRVTGLNGVPSEYDRRDILHLRSVGNGASHGYVGASPVMQVREAIGLALALEEHAGRLFGNGARPAGLLKYAKTLTDVTIKKLRVGFDQAYAGGPNSGRTAILEDGMDFVPLQFNSVDSQFLELRQFQVIEIARAFRIPLHKIGSLERSTNNNIETQNGEFLTDCIIPILKLWEGAIQRSLLSPNERKEYFTEFLVDDLIRADLERRFAAYSVAILNGVLNPNECRALENRPGYAGGEIFMRPLNTAPTTGRAQP
ncbi:MAG: phage portal protein [Alphaproteobacteria bacterium]|nr:phage portal protein [Alphaproteobacteria bacterium]